MDDLSNNARVVLASAFMNPRSSVFYGMVQSVPTPEAEGAINELIAKGILHRAPEPGGGFRLTLTDEGKAMDRRPPGDTAEQMSQFILDNNFSLSMPKEDRMSKPGNALKATGVTAERAQAAQNARNRR